MQASPMPERVAKSSIRAGLPLRAGVGLKPAHYQSLLDDADPPGFVEVHAENYMGAGGAPHAWLTRIRERLPLSLHGVGLSIGGLEPLDETHLDRLALLVQRYCPDSFSEHLAWSTHAGVYYNDLLPVAYDDETLRRVCEHIDRVQERLGLRMLLENPATYLEFEASTLAETDFITQVLRRTGCGLLLDVNNVHVSCINHQRDPRAYLDALLPAPVGEIHLAGHTADTDGNGDRLLIDSHNRPVDDAVWDLYAYALARTGPVATLIEWDSDLPEYSVLCAHARQAEKAMSELFPETITQTGR